MLNRVCRGLAVVITDGGGWPVAGAGTSQRVRGRLERLLGQLNEVGRMNISVFGLGYVGSVSAASLAADGHQVVGVDVNPDKVAQVNGGRSPIVEPGSSTCIARDSGRGPPASDDRRRTRRFATASVSLVCVGTPSRRNGSLDLTHLTRVCEQIGAALSDKPAYHVVVVRSTVLPGTTHDVVIPALERTSGKKYGDGFGVAVNPEFLREGTAIKDFRDPPLTLVGHNHAADATRRPSPSTRDRGTARQHQHRRGGDGEIRRATPSTP